MAGVRSAQAGVAGLETEKRPIRERLVHLLGVRPYRRADLLLRLQQDGLTDGEKEELDQLLLEVCQASAIASAITSVKPISNSSANTTANANASASVFKSSV